MRRTDDTTLGILQVCCAAQLAATRGTRRNARRSLGPQKKNTPAKKQHKRGFVFLFSSSSSFSGGGEKERERGELGLLIVIDAFWPYFSAQWLLSFAPRSRHVKGVVGMYSPVPKKMNLELDVTYYSTMNLDRGMLKF